MNTKTKKLNPSVRKWVAALRSGKFKQAKGVLHRVRHRKSSFCCLGLACKLYNEAHKRKLKVDRMSDRSYDGEDAVLPKKVQRWIGLDSDTGLYGEVHSLAQLNDDGVNFNEIADLIESQPPGLFA